MTIQHKNIQEADLHEPKGVSTASLGKVYTADGAGSGDWEYPPGKGHAEIYITSGETAHTIAAASAFSLLNPSGEWKASGAEHLLSVNPSSGIINLNLAGHYYIDFWITFSTASVAANKLYTFKFALDGTVGTRKVVVSKATTGIDTITVAASGIVIATAGQELSMYLAGDDTTSGTDIIPIEAGLTAIHLD